MKRSAAAATAVAVAVVVGVVVMCGGVGRAVTLEQPARIEIADGTAVVMTVEYCPWTVYDSDNSTLFSGTTRCYCAEYMGMDYGCSVPGPTLVMTAGTTASVDYRNMLTGETAAQTEQYTENTYHGADVTNLHTHGLHVSPEEDDVLLTLDPGASRIYNYTLPSNHWFGTHWYHAHHHGSTNLQVTGGMVGALELRGTQMSFVDNYPAHWLVVHYFYAVDSASCDCNNAATVSTFRNSDGAFSADSTCYIWCSYPAQHRAASGYTYDFDAAANAEYVLVNGQHRPTLQMRKNEWNWLRIVNAMGMYYGEFALPAQCQAKLYGNDGVWFDSPRDLAGAPYAGATILNPGSRADVMVKCSAAGSFSVSMVQTQAGQGTHRAPAGVLLTLEVSGVDGAAATMAEPTNVPAKPNYLADLRDANIANTGLALERNCPCNNWDEAEAEFGGVCGFDLGFLGGGGGGGGGGRRRMVANRRLMQSSDSGDGGGNVGFPGGVGAGAVNGVAFNKNVPLAFVKYNQVYEFIIDGGAHPYHQHINHFQVIGNVGNGGYFAADGDWRDTMAGDDAVVRMFLADFTGKVVQHCHFLPHEDFGMMSYYLMVDGDNLAQYYAEYPMLETCFSRTSGAFVEVKPVWLSIASMLVLVVFNLIVV